MSPAMRAAISFTVCMIFSALITCQPAKADDSTNDIWVFGDSLSSVYYGWASMISNARWAQIRNAARPGMKMTDLSIPKWLACHSSATTRSNQVLIWLGTNDTFVKTPQTVFTQKLVEALDTLEQRGCHVYLVLIPEYEDHDLRAQAEPYRHLLNAIGSEYPNVEIIDPVYAEDQTLDTVHQTKGLHFWQAMQFAVAMRLSGPPAK